MDDLAALPVLSVAVIGQVDQGKTTLCAALTHVARGTPRSREQLLEPEGRYTGRTLVGKPLECATLRRRYVLWDSPGHPDRGKNAARALSQVDAALLVVSAAAGPGDQTREHLRMAHAFGIRSVVVFLGQTDVQSDPELLDMVERELRELLDECGYDGDGLPIIRGSALRALEGGERAPLHELLAALDALPLPPRTREGPLRIPIAARHSGYLLRPPRGHIPGAIAVGRVERGVLRRGEVVQLVGHEGGRPVEAAQLRRFAQVVDELGPGELAGCKLAGVHAYDITRGQVLTRPGEALVHRACRVDLRFFPRQRWGPRSYQSGYRPQVFVRAADITGTLDLGGLARAEPGERVSAIVTLDQATLLTDAPGILLRDAGLTLAAGTIVELLES